MILLQELLRDKTGIIKNMRDKKLVQKYPLQLYNIHTFDSVQCSC
jgi:hypothetical protein